MASVDIRESRTSLALGEVHVWRTRLSASAGQVSLLSADEQERADRFRSHHDRSRFIAARALLRQLLGDYLGAPPGQLVFGYGAHGKPRVESDQAITFNLSHAADMALIAFARENDLGVDLESAAVLLDPESVVQRCMSKRERRLLHRVPAETRDEAILTTWVRKEAVAKGRGEGLGLPLAGIGTRPGVPASGQPVIVRTSRRDRWFVWDLPVGGGAAALASRRRDISIRLFDHPGTVIDLTGSDPLPSKDTSVSLTP